jgi:hypothetical protein
MKELAALLLAALVVPGAVSAKPGQPGSSARPETVEMCGPGGCEAVRLSALRGALVRWDDVRFAAPPPLAPYYELRSELFSPDGGAGFYVPSRDVLKVSFTGQPEWIRASPRAARRLEQLISGEPWPAPMITEAFVGTRRAAAAGAYAGVFDPAPAAASPPDARAQQVLIALRSERVSPWTDGYTALAYLPEQRLLRRDAEYVRTPDALVELIERDAGLAPSAPAGGSDGATTTRVLVGALLVLLAGTLVGLRRRLRLSAR